MVRPCAASVLVLAVALAAGSIPRPGAAAASRELRYVVIVARHGVRAPTWTVDRLNQFSAEPWPDFGVPPGYLTRRGAGLMTIMGRYYGERLAGEGLLQRSGCADASRVYVWADIDQRTLETGRMLADGVLPGCAVAVHAYPPGQGEDPIFDPIAAGLAKPDREIAVQAVRDRIIPSAKAFLEARAAVFAELHRVLTGGGAASQMPFRAPSELDVRAKDGFVELTGPLDAASTLTENLLLEYADGLPGQSIGWGRMDAGGLARVLELHTAYADLMRRTFYLARARSSNLLAHVLNSMEQAATGKAIDGALGIAGDKALIVVGHDTNLSNISGMLGLSWKLPGYPADDTPPGGAIVFSLWQDSADGQLSVKTQYLAQTPDQMHDAVPLTLATPPAMQELTVPGCDPRQSEGCPWPSFVRAMRKAIDPAFVYP